MPRLPRIALLFISAVLLLGACATIERQGRVEVAAIDERDGLVRLGAPWSDGAAIRRVRYLDRTELEEYAAYDGPAGRGEIFYATVTASPYALADEFDIGRAIELFAFVKGRAGEVGPSTAASNGATRVFARPFRLQAAARACVGFKAAWDDVAYDPERRPATLFFGYFCASPGTAFDAEASAQLVASIAIEPPPELIVVGAEPDRQDSALALARGSDEAGERGLPDFPLLLARHYREEGSGERRESLE